VIASAVEDLVVVALAAAGSAGSEADDENQALEFPYFISIKP
jgi:hypothetical protein